MVVPARSSNAFIGSFVGKPNAKKLTRIYNAAYSQITELCKMLPESARKSLLCETSSPEPSMAFKGVLQKNSILDLDSKVNSLKGTQLSYQEKLIKRKLKNQLRKRKKSEVKKRKSEEKNKIKEEMRKQKKELIDQRKSEKMSNGSSALESDLDEDDKEDGSTVEEEMDVGSQSEEEVQTPARSAKPKTQARKIEEIAAQEEEEETPPKEGGLSKKKMKLLAKKEMMAERKREKRKLLKEKKKEEALTKVQETVKTEEVVEVKEEKKKGLQITYNKIELEGENVKKKFKRDKPKVEKDPVKALERIENLNKRITDLKESGNKEKAAEIKSKESWKQALLRAEGVKVKDNVHLLKKTIRRQENKKKKSQTEWKQRKETVEKRKADAQKKRKENIQKKKKEKKQKKIKKSIKKGRVVI